VTPAGAKEWSVRLLVRLVRLYQVTLSPLIGGQCRYTPTCSEYFIEAVLRRGAVRGSLMGLWRIIRCNPFSRGGFDPVGEEDAHHDGGRFRPHSNRRHNSLEPTPRSCVKAHGHTKARDWEKQT